MIALTSAIALASPLVGEPDPVNLAFVTASVGSNDPFRPGLPGPVLDTGLLVGFRSVEIAFDVERHGDDALALRGSSSITSLGVFWAPTWRDSPSRLLRVGLSPWLVLDIEPRTGLTAEVAYGTQGRNGSLAGFASVSPPYWADSTPIDGLMVGADLRLHHRFGLVGVRTGLVGLRRPEIALTFGVGAAWGHRYRSTQQLKTTRPTQAQ